VPRQQSQSPGPETLVSPLAAMTQPIHSSRPSREPSLMEFCSGRWPALLTAVRESARR
jgi:hypothetical protein